MSKYYVYYGGPSERIFGRIECPSEESCIMAIWNDGSLFGMHSADVETFWSREFENMSENLKTGHKGK